jgi:hypothetical protein
MAMALSCLMKNSDVPMMTLRRAVQLCNGVDALSDALNVSSGALERMLAGAEEVPPAVFTQAVGLLLEATATRAPKRPTPDSNEGGRKGPRH